MLEVTLGDYEPLYIWQVFLSQPRPITNIDYDPRRVIMGARIITNIYVLIEQKRFNSVNKINWLTVTTFYAVHDWKDFWCDGSPIFDF